MTTVILVLALLILVITGNQLVDLGKANPALAPYQELGNVAPDSLTKSSKVTIFSPINSSVYTTTPLPLSVNVTLPESKTALGTILYFIIYQTDWQENKTYLYTNEGYSNSIESQIPGIKHQYFQDTRNLTDIPDGNHSITITAVAGGWYPGDCGFYRFMINGSSTVFFTTGVQPTPTVTITVDPFPTQLIVSSVIVVAVVGLGLLVYFKKRYSKTGDRT